MSRRRFEGQIHILNWKIKKYEEEDQNAKSKQEKQIEK